MWARSQPTVLTVDIKASRSSRPWPVERAGGVGEAALSRGLGPHATGPLTHLQVERIKPKDHLEGNVVQPLVWLLFRYCGTWRAWILVAVRTLYHVEGVGGEGSRYWALVGEMGSQRHCSIACQISFQRREAFTGCTGLSGRVRFMRILEGKLRIETASLLC